MCFKNLIEIFDKVNKQHIEIYGCENYDSFEKYCIIEKYYKLNKNIYKLGSFLEQRVKAMEAGNIFLVLSELNSERIFLQLYYQYVFYK